MTRPLALVLTGPGTNRDGDAVDALDLAGAEPRVVPIGIARTRPELLSEAQLLMIAGGFSYGDALGAGRLLALDLEVFLADALAAFVAAGKPVIGVCNGFQALVRAGILPGGGLEASLGHNAEGRFECRWVTLEPRSSHCIWTAGLTEPILCPVAHGEGRFVAPPATVDALRAGDRIALTYDRDEYPANPNGSIAAIAGVCDAGGTVIGLMPHPEDHVTPRQHPRRSRGEQGGSGLVLFENGVRHAKEL
jgi:phosphoribosylformylglycinamidine synthase